MSFEIIWMAIVFCIIAFLYWSVGFGGGSSYTAVLALVGFSAAAIPVVALSCNLVVATGGAIRFVRMGHFPWKRMMPLFVLSIPCAYLAGRYRIPSTAYFLLLGLALAAASFLLWRKGAASDKETLRPLYIAVAAYFGLRSNFLINSYLVICIVC